MDSLWSSVDLFWRKRADKIVWQFFSIQSIIQDKLWEILSLQVVAIWAFALLGNGLFSRVGDYGGIDEVINIETVTSSFWTLFLLLVFHGLDVIYLGLEQSHDCFYWPFHEEIKSRWDALAMYDHIRLCGNKPVTIAFLVTYEVITFFVLLNIYAVLTYEILTEIKSFQK